MPNNEFDITILEDGITKINTDAFSSASHQIAEKALLWIAQELGGEVTKIKKTHSHVHNHDHEHNHSH